MTTAQQLIQHDIKESLVILNRHAMASSLSLSERRKHRPVIRTYPRDRVLHAIMRREMEFAIRKIRGE